MKYLGRFLALIAATLFVATLPSAIWFMVTGDLVSNPDIYKDAIVSHDGYRNIIPAVLPAITEEKNRAELELEDPEVVTFLQIIENLKQEDWEMIAQELVPAEWLQEQFESNIDGFFAWINGETPTPNINFATGDLRERLEGPPGQRAVNLIMESWPDCTDEELAVLLALDTDNAIPFCQPPGEYAAFVSEALTDILRQEAQNLPDQVPEEDWLHNPETRSTLAQIKFGIRIVEATITELWLICLAMLALIVTFTVRSMKSFLRWTGVTTFIGAAMALLPVPMLLSQLMTGPIISWLFTENTPAPGGSPGVPLSESNYGQFIIYDLTSSIVIETAMPVIILSIVLIGAAFVALIIAAFLRYPEEKLAEALSSGTVTLTPPPTGTFAMAGQVTPTPFATVHTSAEAKTPPPSQTSSRNTADPFAPPDPTDSTN